MYIKLRVYLYAFAVLAKEHLIIRIQNCQCIRWRFFKESSATHYFPMCSANETNCGKITGLNILLSQFYSSIYIISVPNLRGIFKILLHSILPFYFYFIYYFFGVGGCNSPPSCSANYCWLSCTKYICSHLIGLKTLCD